MSFSTRIKVLAAIFLVAGPFMAYKGYEERNRLAELEKNGVTVDGIIGGGESHTGKSSSYTFTVTYKLADGSPVTHDFKVEQEFFKAHVRGDSIGVPNVKVRYASNKPDNAIIVDGSTDEKNLLPIGIGTFFGCAALLGFMFYRDRH